MLPGNGKRFEDPRNEQQLTRLICDFQGEGERAEVTHIEVSLGKRKDTHFSESDEKKKKKSEYLKMLGVNVGKLVPRVPRFICEVGDLVINVRG